MRRIAMIEIKLVSETIFGGDGEQIGTTDMEIQADECGFPYYSGRTLKGVLREQAEWYMQCLPDDPKLKDALYKLFGKTREDNNESLRFGKAKLGDTIYDFAKQQSVDKRDIFHALTEVRSMTSIDQTGIVKKGSLRQARVMKPGYVFYAPIFIQGELNDSEQKLLETAVKLVRHIGLMRHRGKGEVECKIKWLETEQQKPATSVQQGPFYDLTIHLHEPLKISHVLGTSDSTHALRYIPGYVIRGAMIHAYLQSTGTSPNELDTGFIFAPDHVQFWNGYLELEGNRTLPFAHHLFESKDQSKEAAGKRKVYNALDEASMKEIRDRSPVRVSRNVMAINSEHTLLVGKVNTTSSLHTSVNGSDHRERHNQSQLYRYEAIAPQQTFRSAVVVVGDHPFTQWLSRQTALTLWLGGARNSGYGRVTVHLSVSDQSPEQPVLTNVQNAKELYILATSDWIVRDDQGRPTSSLDEQWLGEQLGVSIKLETQVVNTQLSGGYISLWRAYQPMVSAVQSGSIFRYSITAGTLDPIKLARFMERGVGARVNEGFGRLIVFDEWSFVEISEANAQTPHVKSVVRGEVIFDRMQIEMVKKNLTDMDLLQKIRERVKAWKESVAGEKAITSAQWGKLLQVASGLLVQSLKLEQTENPQERWRSFWKDVEERTKNKPKLGFGAVRVDKEKLKDFIEQQLRHEFPMDLSIKPDEGIDYEHWNLRAIELFFRQMIRGRYTTNKGSDLT